MSGSGPSSVKEEAEETMQHGNAPVAVASYSVQDMANFIQDSAIRNNLAVTRQLPVMGGPSRIMGGQMLPMPASYAGMSVKPEQIRVNSTTSSSSSAMSTRATGASRQTNNRTQQSREILRRMAEENKVDLTDSACDLLTDHLFEILEYLSRQSLEFEEGKPGIKAKVGIRQKAEVIIYHAMAKYAGFERYPHSSKRKDESEVSNDTKRPRK